MRDLLSYRMFTVPRAGTRGKWLALAVLAMSVAMLASAQDSALRRCSFSAEQRDYRNCNFTEAELKGLDFEGADLRGARMDWVRMDGANLQEANLDASALGPKAPSLYRAHFKSCLLVGANFHKAQLAYSHFDIADLSEANMEGANLEGATIIAAYAVGTNFRHANLRGVRFMESDLSEADLSGADLRLADFEFAKIDGVKFDGADLTGALSPAGFRCKGSEKSLSECVLARHNYDRYAILLAE